MKDYSYKTKQSTFFPNDSVNTYKEQASKKSKDAINLINNGVLPKTTDIYFPKMTNTKLPNVTLVTHENFQEVLNEIGEYHKKHEEFAISFDYEVFNSYNFSLSSLLVLKQKYNLDVTYLKQYKDKKFQERLSAIEERHYYNELIHKIMDLHNQKIIDINQYIIQRPNYEYDSEDLIKASVLYFPLSIVGYTYGFDTPIQNFNIINTLYANGFNLLEDNWFEKWLNQPFNKAMINKEVIFDNKEYLNESNNFNENTTNYDAFISFTKNIEDSKKFYADLGNNLPLDKDFLFTNLKEDYANLNKKESNTLKIYYAFPKYKINNWLEKYNHNVDDSSKITAFEPELNFNLDNNDQVDVKEKMKLVVDELIKDKSLFSHLIWQNPDDVIFFNFLMCSFAIEDKVYTFLENQLVNYSLPSYLNKADSLELLNHFWLIGINKGWNFYSVAKLHIKSKVI